MMTQKTNPKQKQKKRPKKNINGWLIIDKGRDIGSTDVVNKVKYLSKAKKVGHAGTLDPMATGILPIALGEATKTVPYAQDAIKTYSFDIKWGIETDSLDADGDVIETCEQIPSETEMQACLSEFIGEITQTPPAFSAIKINGERAYDLARAGKKVEIKSRQVMIHDLIYLGKGDETGTNRFQVTCGKGTYVRSLARDIAHKLGSLGHLTYLRREKVGVFNLSRAISLDAFEKIVQSAPAEEVILPVETALDDIPVLAISGEQAKRLRTGQQIRMVTRQDIESLEQAKIGFKAKAQTALARLPTHAVGLIEVNGIKIKAVRLFNL